MPLLRAKINGAWVDLPMTGPTGPRGLQGVEGLGGMDFRGSSNRWGTCFPMPVVATVITTQIGYVYAMRTKIGVNCKTIAATVSTAAGTGVFRLGVYDDSAYPYPGNLLGVSGDLSAAATGQKTYAINLSAGTYYWLALHNPGPVTIAMRGTNYGNPWAPGGTASFDIGASNPCGYSQSGYSGVATPNPWPANQGTDTSQIVFYLQAT
jgi:hypothetical protein